MGVQNITGSSFQTRAASPGLPSLQKGDLFQAKAAKLLPNQQVILQIGKNSISGKLSAPLQANVNYLFRVENNQETLHLKVLGALPADGQGKVAGMAPLLQKAGMNGQKGIQALVQSLLQKNIPFSQAFIEQSSRLLKETSGVNLEKSIEALAAMAAKKIMPDRALLAAAVNSKSTASVFRDTQQALFNMQNPGMTVRALTRQLGDMETLLQLNKNQTSVSPALLDAAKAVLDRGSESSLKEGAFSLLIKAGAAAPGQTQAAWTAALYRAAVSDSSAPVQSPQIQQQFLHTFFKSIESLSPEAQWAKAGQLFTSTVPGEIKPLHALIQPGSSPLQPLEQKALTQLFQAKASADTFWNPSFESLSRQWLQLQQKLGLFHEASITQSNARPAPDMEVKSLLLQAQAELSGSARQQLDPLLGRITSQQLQALEQPGILQQLQTQIPLFLGSFAADLTIDWEAKKTPDGSLDPDHCRMLLHVTLEKLGETAADITIQNRKLQLTIYNGQAKPEGLFEMLKPFLETQLGRMNYDLYSVNWKQTEEIKKQIQPSVMRLDNKGVDVRI
ncbi:hypothetical protein [Sinobaca sp. H24]|uniref:hypothetical protein n=1 Tax=Sinobaca sp. H24 TaxID=2923376 RepID=UPI00207AF0BA|nr:hypothetical protein [Sinobaca sp. H24]